MDFPSNIFIKATLGQGTIYYFKEDSFDSSVPHYFVVLNRNATTDNYIYLVNATSKIDKALARIKNQNLPNETLVILEPSECPIFTQTSAFDCNKITKKHFKELISLVDKKTFLLKGQMAKCSIEKLQKAIKKSPLIENRIKKKI